MIRPLHEVEEMIAVIITRISVKLDQQLITKDIVVCTAQRYHPGFGLANCSISRLERRAFEACQIVFSDRSVTERAWLDFGERSGASRKIPLSRFYESMMTRFAESVVAVGEHHASIVCSRLHRDK